MKNIMERFMIRMANRSENLYINLELSDNIYTSLIEESIKKKLFNNRNALIFASYIKTKIRDHLKRNIMDDLTTKIIKTKNEYKYKDFCITLHPLQFEYFKKMDDKNVMKMLIRYTLLFLGGQQWNLPSEWYKHIMKCNFIDNPEYIEGFASPLNSQMIGKYPYFSLFNDTDSYFGSFGNLFKVPLNVVKNKIIVNNPPYIIDIMEKLIDKQTEWLENVPVFIIMCVAAWEDAEYFKKSMKSKFLLCQKRLHPGFHFFETVKNGKLISIKSKTSSHLFIFSSMDKKTYKIEKLTSGI